MNLPNLIYFTAFLLEGFGTYVSVLGLASGSPILIGISISLDLAKLVNATVLYKYWKRIPIVFRTFMLLSLLFLMFLTSSGTYGFLTREFGKSMTQQSQITTKIDSLNDEKTKLEARKKEMDDQIKNLPSDQVVQRKKLNELFAPELSRINERIIQLDKDVPELKLSLISGQEHMGTVGSIANSLKIDVNEVIKMISLLIVLVIDPLAVVLLTVGNMVVDFRKQDKETEDKKAKEMIKEEELEKIKFQKEIENAKKELISEQKIQDNNNKIINESLDENKNKEIIYKTEFIKDNNIDVINEKKEIQESNEENIEDILDSIVNSEVGQQLSLNSLEQGLNQELILEKKNKKISGAPILNRNNKVKTEKNDAIDIFDETEIEKSEIENILGISQSKTNPNMIVPPTNTQKE